MFSYRLIRHPTKIFYLYPCGGGERKLPLMEDVLIKRVQFFLCFSFKGRREIGKFTDDMPINDVVRLENEPDFRFERDFDAAQHKNGS